MALGQAGAYEWEPVTPRAVGFSEDLGDRLDTAVRDGKLNNIHGVVLVRDGKLVLERYFTGPDYRWSQRLGIVDFTSETLHDLRSVSKSVVGLLYGIALAEGKVPALDTALVEAFPQYGDLAANPERRRIKVAHALTMQLGLEWNENLPYTDANNSEIAMERAPDRYRFVLERPIVSEPGTSWQYSGGATALLAYLITEGTGMSLLDYVRTRLFEPLGIDNAEWVRGDDGVEAAASGLRMRPADLAKLGQLALDKGAGVGQQLVPTDWLASSFQPHANVDDDLAYGYQWWIARRWNWVAAFGNGGQRMMILPRMNAVLVVTAGNYDQPDAWRVPVSVLVDVVLPSAEK
ncbi:serine hydrolase domain-containing protein [Candidatus Entotheonella palauensis]|uniref:serine hydrolase domain-containing protein n=1 Tax=Candidatus Entotheonella palauensis TaxID=93172 RepID=UPI000B7C9DDA|nr:serine hydrolase [Candidatus Entotheonella palauensis]